MAFQVINIGAVVNDGTGDTLRDGGDKINDNFAVAVEGPAAAVVNERIVVFDGTTGRLVKQASLGVSALLPLTGGALTGEVTTTKQVASAVTSFGVTGSIDLDFAESMLATTGTLTGNITFTGTGYAAGRSITIRVVNGGTLRTVAFPADWVFVGAKPTDIAANKSAVLTVTAFGTTEASCIAAWAAQT
jgi:hypothetical protein